MKTRTIFLSTFGMLVCLTCFELFGRSCRGADAPVIKSILENGGLEGELDPDTSLPAGWEVTQDPPNSYKVEVVDGGRSGRKCLRISGDGKNVQVRVKFLPMGPDHRSVSSGWMQYISGPGMVSFINRYQDANGGYLTSTRHSSYRELQENNKTRQWRQAATIEFPEMNPPGADANFVIDGKGKFEALFDDLEVFTLAVTPNDLLWGMRHFEVHGFQTGNPMRGAATYDKGPGEFSLDEKRPASGRYCLRIKAKGDSATSSWVPKNYDPGKVYTLTGKVRVNSGRGTIRIDYYKDRKKTELLGSAIADAVASEDWQVLTVDTSDNPPEGAAFIVATCVCLADSEAFFDELTLLAK